MNEPRASLRWFAEQCEAKLARDDDTKGGFIGEQEDTLLEGLKAEVGELEEAMSWSSDTSDVIQECADVANYAMMIALSNTPLHVDWDTRGRAIGYEKEAQRVKAIRQMNILIQSEDPKERGRALDKLNEVLDLNPPPRPDSPVGRVIYKGFTSEPPDPETSEDTYAPAGKSKLAQLARAARLVRHKAYEKPPKPDPVEEVCNLPDVEFTMQLAGNMANSEITDKELEVIEKVRKAVLTALDDAPKPDPVEEVIEVTLPTRTGGHVVLEGRVTVDEEDDDDRTSPVYPEVEWYEGPKPEDEEDDTCGN